MVCPVILLFGILCANGDALTTRLSTRSAEESIKTLGVWPAVLREQSESDSAAFDAHGQLIVSSLVTDLAAQAKNSGISLLTTAQMNEAFPDAKTSKELSDNLLAAIKTKATSLGLDGIVFAFLTDCRQKPDEDGFTGLKLAAKLFHVQTGRLIDIGSDNIHMTLGDAAYLGESFELRRWVDGELRDVGFDAQLLATDPHGFGPLHEQIQYQAIRRDKVHPLGDPEAPLKLGVSVLGKERKPHIHSSHAYVGLDAGDVYAIDIENKNAEDVYMLLLIDGINVLGKTAEFPSEAPTNRYWHLKGKGRFRIDGWTMPAAGGGFDSQRFIVTERQLSVAGKQGATNRIGNITAVFLTSGLPAVSSAEVDRSILRRGSFATGAGMSRRLDLELAQGKPAPGILLAAITVHYLPTAEIEKMVTIDGKK